MMAVTVRQLVRLVVLVALIGGVASKMPRDGPTKALLDWEQEKLRHDEYYFSDAIMRFEKQSTRQSLWQNYIKPALEIRKKIIGDAMDISASKPLKEAKELLFRAHRRAYAEITPNMEGIMENFDEFARYESTVRFDDPDFIASIEGIEGIDMSQAIADIKEIEESNRINYSKRLRRIIISIERRLIRRINNYFYETVAKKDEKYRYLAAQSFWYYRPNQDILDLENEELNELAYYSEDGENVFIEEMELANIDSGEKLFKLEKKQLMYDYQFIRTEIAMAGPQSLMIYAAIHQIYAAVEKREAIINDAMDDSSSAVNTLEEARAALLKAHRLAQDEIRSYLEQADSYLEKDVDNTAAPIFKTCLRTVKERFERGLSEYSTV